MGGSPGRRHHAQVLERLGLDKKGRKADMQARVAAYFGEAVNGAVQPPREQYKIDAAGAGIGS